MNAALKTIDLLLPWESTGEEDARYRKILRNALSAFIAFALIVPFLPVEELSREQQEAVPPHLARVILEKKVLPVPPPPAKVKPKPVEKQKPRPEPVASQTAKPKPRDQLEQARKVAAVSGVLAFQDVLKDMRDNIDVSSLNEVGMSRGDANAAQVSRKVISSGITSSSGGIQTAALSVDNGGPALAGRETTRVENSIASSYQGQTSSESARLGGRSDDAIRRVMDRNKGAIFAIYNRALRKNPALQGKLVFEMVVNPAGAVTELTLLSSELEDDALSRKILARIRMIQFGNEDVSSTRVNYSFDFLPY
jgi:protein TonB